MVRTPRGNRASPVIIRVLVSLLAGGLTYLLTTFTGQTNATTLVVSVFVGGVFLVVQYLAEFEGRLGAFEGRLNTLNVATKLYDSIERSPIGVRDITKFIDNVSALDEESPALVTDLARYELRRITQFFSELRAGEATYNGEDRDWLLRLVESAQHSIVATSNSKVDDGFWETELGERYLKVQGDAGARGVVVRRVFVVDDEALVQEPDFKKICDRQRNDFGIEVKVVVLSQLSVSQQNTYRDFVLFDQSLFYQVTAPTLSSGRTSGVVQTRLSTREVDLGFARSYFAGLWTLDSGY